METIRSELAVTPATCEETRWQMCRLAAGLTLANRARPVARHVRDCRSCDAFVDELAALREWLLRHRASLDVDSPASWSGGEVNVRQAASRALCRELEARLARDLLAMGLREPTRPVDERRRDVCRAGLLRGHSSVSDSTWKEATEAVLIDSEVPRDVAIPLAARLDPLGLDIALVWLGQLTRSGREQEAQRVTDRLLAAVP